MRFYLPIYTYKYEISNDQNKKCKKNQKFIIAENVPTSQQASTENTSADVGNSHLQMNGHAFKGFSLTWKLLQKNSVSPDETILNQNLQEFRRESRPYVLNPKYSTPTSLPLYFYFVYQLLQESKRLEECGPVS